MNSFNKTFSKKQIKKFERLRKDLLTKICIFEAGMKFVKRNYYVKEKFLDRKPFSFNWIEELKSAINNVYFEDNIIAGEKVSNNLTLLIAIVKYLAEIEGIVAVRSDPTINKLINEYRSQILEMFNN